MIRATSRRPFVSRLHAALIGMVITAPLAAQTPAPQPPPIDGVWVMTLELPVGVAKPSITFTHKGDELAGTYEGRYGRFPITGLVRGQVVTFTFQMGTELNPVTVCFTGEWVAGQNTLKGTATIGELGRGTWTAERDPDRAKQP